MGLLGDSMDDPRTMATLQLAAGLLSPGSFGQGLGKGLSGYQGTLANAQEMQQRQQAMQMQALQIAQQRRMFDLQTPFLEEAVKRLQGQSAPASQAPDPNAGSTTMQAPSVMFSPDVNAQRAQMPATPPTNAQPTSAAPQGGSLFPGVPDSVAFGMIGTGNFNKLGDTISTYNSPTDFVKTLTAAGIDPSSAIGRQFIQNNIAKTNYIAPVNVRPGAILRNPFTMQPMAFNPHIPEGGTPVFDASGNVTAINPLQGAAGVMQAAEAAKAAGNAQFTPFAGKDASGNPAPVTSVANALGTAPNQNPGFVSPADQAARNTESLRVLQEERARTPAGPDRDALDKVIRATQNAALTGKPFSVSTTAPNGGLYAEAPLGAAQGAANAQDTMTGSYKNVMAANTSAQTIQARLSNIHQLADSAITGGDTEYRDAANNLLSIAFPGDIGKQATDRKTAGDLIDKNAAQIALAIGAGSNGTDALRALAAAANPGRHMTPQAIGEAVAQLQGSAQINQAKAALLTPLYSAGSPAAYLKAEQAFDNNADYRIFQLKNMTPQQAALYLSKLPKSEQDDLRAKASALKAMQVF